MTTAPPASCMSTEHGCVMFDCLVHIWEWLDPPIPQTQFEMDNKNTAPATQQPLTQQHIMAHHVHADQIYSQQPQTHAHHTSMPIGQIQTNGVMHQLLQSQYHSNMNARSPLLENRHDLYSTGYSHDYARHYGANDNYNHPQSPPRVETTEVRTDHNVNQELLHNIPKGYNAEVYQDYLKRNPPKDTNQIYQNHYPMCRPNVNQYGSKPYLPYSNRTGPQSNTELLRRQYNEIQQLKLQQQMHYQNQAQMHQQQKFAERQLLLQQMHGVQPPPNFQNSIYSDGSYRDVDRYSSKNDFKDYSSPESQKDIYPINTDSRDNEVQNLQYQDAPRQAYQRSDFRDTELQRRPLDEDMKKGHTKDYNNQHQKTNVGVVSPIKSSESSTPSIKSPSSDGRRSSGGTQALRSPTAQRIPSAPVTMSGILYKQGSDGLRVWRKRWFVLSEFCLFYYKSQDEEKLLGSVLLPSYKVSACTPEDKVLRKFSFKLEHANMRTYILAAPDQEAMMKWVKVLTMAALMQNSSDQRRNQNERTAAKTEDGDEVPMYVNAPPKPRRSNEGYSSPSPDMYDPNYDLLKKPPSHYNQDPNYIRYSDNTNYPNSPNQESMYTRSPQLPPPQQNPYQKRQYDTHNLSLPLTNANDKLDINQPSTSGMSVSNSRSPYFDRTKMDQHQATQEKNQQLYERHTKRNPFLQDTHQMENQLRELELQNKSSRQDIEQDRSHTGQKPSSDSKIINNSLDISNRDVYGEANVQSSRSGSNVNDRLIDRRTPDTYGRSITMSSYSKEKLGDYEDVYGADNEYGKTQAQTPNITQARDNVSISSHQQQRNAPASGVPEKIFTGPAVLRRKKMQSSGIQPPAPRPHSADFLEYESNNEILNKSATGPVAYDPPRQPQRPKSSLDINSPYDPSSDRYYSEESYAEKMRQSVQYLQPGLAPKNIEIPLAKYASGLAQKQLSSAYSHMSNNNYETEFSTNRMNRDNVSYNSKCDIEGLNSNWTLKEKITENQKDFLIRSGSVMSDGSNVSGFIKNATRTDPNSDAFMRSASARLPTTQEKDGEKKVQQREESMKRLLEWKQRMLQSPLQRKSTPATISLARSLNQNRQSLRSDQYKSKSYANSSYNSYSSDDEEESSGTELQNSKEMQAGRSHTTNLNNKNIMNRTTPAAVCVSKMADLNNSNIKDEVIQTDSPENAYENILCSISIPKVSLENDYEDPSMKMESPKYVDNMKLETMQEDGYETHESEAESEAHIEYSDNDLDEVLLGTDIESQAFVLSDVDCIKKASEEIELKTETEEAINVSLTPPLGVVGENHYLPMSPRKVSTIEMAHKNILHNLCVHNLTKSERYEDNPYVEMNMNNENDDTQTYEVVCINNGKTEPVYMELSNVTEVENKSDNSSLNSRLSVDAASNFADTKEPTLKRATKSDKASKDKYDCSDADDEASKDISLETPFSRFSISDTFRPASYYLSSIGNRILDTHDDSLDSEIISPPPVPTSSPPCDNLSDEALSQYILDKLDQSDMSHDNSILKMLTSENKKMNTIKKKTTSLMIYGSPTSIYDTLSRGEKVRNSRASLANERRNNNEHSTSFLNNNILEKFSHSSGAETESIRSYNADRGSSRLSLESDVSSKFDMAPSNMSSDVTSLNESDAAIDLRHSSGYQNLEMMIKRRPLSDESFLDLVDSDFAAHDVCASNINLDTYLDNLEPSIINKERSTARNVLHTSRAEVSFSEYPVHVPKIMTTHARCSSTPVNCGSKFNRAEIKYRAESQFINISDQTSSYRGSQNLCSSNSVIPKSQISYYCKSYDEEKLKNLNQNGSADKIKEFESEKLALRNGNETHTSSTSTGFHSRESSTEHSAPYYYSDLSSQEHINVLPTSHYLKNTNLHRKLNNQRRRGPLHKKNEISHIHNPIKNNQVMISEQSFDLASSARSVSVEFLSAADKDPEIDMKNIYESSGGKVSKISESMNLISGLGCKRNSGSNCNVENTSADGNTTNRNSLTKLSSTSMSSHCSGNSSNTVYYDAEADANTYENVVCHGEKLWDEDILWRDNLRRASHRNARSMDNLDAMVTKAFVPSNNNSHRTSYEVNSIKRIKKDSSKIRRNVTYVNCDLQGRALRNGDCNSRLGTDFFREKRAFDENDVYVSLAEDAEMHLRQSDEGVYEQLSELNGATKKETLSSDIRKQNKKKFEIDREKLRQWDLMSSGLIKESRSRARGEGFCEGAGESGTCNMDTGTDSASNEASMTMQGTNIESVTNNNSTNQQVLSKKAFLGSNTSIGRNNRDVNIPVRAVSPRVRWVEDKPNSDHYGAQQISTSQHNLNALNGVEDSWSMARSPSRISQQPIRAVSPRVRRNHENEELQRVGQQHGQNEQIGDIPSAGELLGRTHEELVLLLIQLRRRHTATHRAIEHCCTQINSIEDCISSMKVIEREESLKRLEQLKMQLMELEHQYEKSKPLVQLVDNMVKLGSLYNRPGSTIERLERNQRLRQKVLAEHALEQQRWLESVAAGKSLETEAARARVAELWALEQELADEAAILQGLKSDKDTIDTLISGVRGKVESVHKNDLLNDSIGQMERERPANSTSGSSLEAELARVHAMLAHNSKKLEQTVADNARLERELQQLRRALQARRATAPAHPTAMLEDEVSRVQQLVTALQRQRQELSRAVRHLTQQSHALQTTHDSMPGKRRPISSWQETNLDTGHTIDHGSSEYECESFPLVPPGHYERTNVEMPLYVDTRPTIDITSPLNSEDTPHGMFGNLSNVEKQEIKTVRIVKRESERRQRDRERSLQPMSDWPANNITANLDQFLEEELIQSTNYRASSLPRTDYKYDNYYAKTQDQQYRMTDKTVELSPKYVSSPSLSNYDYSQDISSMSSSYNKSYDKSGYERAMSASTQYLNSPTDSSRTLTNDPMSKTSSIVSLTRSNVELSPIFKSEAAKQIITEMAGDSANRCSTHRRQVPKEKRRHYTTPHHLSAKTLNEMNTVTNIQDKMRRSLDDADMERALRGAPAPDVVRSALPPQVLRLADNTIDQLLAAPQKIVIPERYIPEKPPELSPEEQQRRLEKVESIKKMLSGTSADPVKSPDGGDKRQREHLLQMNQLLAKQVTEMSKIIAVKALEELPQKDNTDDSDDLSPDVELPIYQQRDNFFT